MSQLWALHLDERSAESEDWLNTRHWASQQPLYRMTPDILEDYGPVYATLAAPPLSSCSILPLCRHCRDRSLAV